MGNNSKVVVIGLDGAPFEIIREWMDKGILLNLRELRDKGSFGCLQSCFLPESPTAWVSILTGKNPGKHNIFDWSCREKGTYKIRLVNSTDIRSPFIWEILNQRGRKVGIFNVPLTYPPAPVNGFMISGFDTPATSVCFTYPVSLASKIKKHVKDYPLSYRQSYVPGKERDFIDDLKYIINKKKETVFYLIDNFDLDFYLFVLMELDHLHHKMWKFIDRIDTASYFYEVYKSIDDVVKEIIVRFPEDTSFFIISDHGAGPLEGVMCINNWLSQLGLLRFKKNPITVLKGFLEDIEIIPKIFKISSKLGLGKFIRTIPRDIQTNLAMSFLSFNDIDWRNTKAYAFGEYGQIYINLKGREPQGIIESGKDYEALINYIINELLSLNDSSTGERMITRVYRREEVYNGPYLEAGPDILFEIKGLSYDSSVKFGFRKKKIFDNPEFWDSGIHRREGILIAKGKDIKRGFFQLKGTIFDIAPTLLYLMNLDIPQDMDGRILTELFKDDFLKSHPPRYTKESFLSRVNKKEVYFKKKGAERRLKSLGYLG